MVSNLHQLPTQSDFTTPRKLSRSPFRDEGELKGHQQTVPRPLVWLLPSSGPIRLPGQSRQILWWFHLWGQVAIIPIPAENWFLKHCSLSHSLHFVSLSLKTLSINPVKISTQIFIFKKCKLKILNLKVHKTHLENSTYFLPPRWKIQETAQFQATNREVLQRPVTHKAFGSGVSGYASSLKRRPAWPCV